MARYGEGDKRWIVEERADGANVHNWHWAERDCLEWSRQLLSRLLSDLPILTGEGGLVVKTGSLEKLEGEAYVNVRKGKVIPGYELSLSLSWEGEALADSGDPAAPPLLKVKGTLDVPYLADENADEDPDVRITVRGGDGGPVERRIKDAFVAKGKPVVLEKLRAYVQSMATGGPAKDELESKKPKGSPAPAQRPAAGAAAAQGKNEAGEESKNNKKKKGGGKEGFRTISLTERFYCRARDIYEILMDENRWKGFTQSNARINREVGGQFSLFDGSIKGVNEELQDGKLIVQKWRFESWPDGMYSTVRMAFDEPETGVTVINLTQTDVPVEDKYGNATVVENTEKGWRDLIFHKIRSLFGFGM
uniref:Activator heat shock protein ATPase n=1 Tax=Anthurium amnicola TaxID=1678845 RepID=A0A1D1YZ06_9ARAE